MVAYHGEKGLPLLHGRCFATLYLMLMGCQKMLTPEQFQQLLALAQRLSEPRLYTLTGAQDWPMLVVMAGMVIALIGLMWADLRSKLTANDQDHAKLWRAHEDCQADCCPRGVRRYANPRDNGHRRRFDDQQEGE